MHRKCSSCCRVLPASDFPKSGSKRRPECRLCYADYQRAMAGRLAPIKPDPLQIHLNNLACLWFGPVRPAPRFTV